MQRESPLQRGERFAIEAQLLAQWLDAANYDVTTFAVTWWTTTKAESPPVSSMLGRSTRSRFSVGPPSKRLGLSRMPWISDVRDIAKTNVGSDLQSSQPPLAAIPRPRCSKNPAVTPVGRMDARVVWNGITDVADFALARRCRPQRASIL
jgi:hypothetical protein